MRKIRELDLCCSPGALVHGRRATRVALAAAILVAAGWSAPVHGQSAADSAQLIDTRGKDAYRTGTREGREEAIRLFHQAVVLYRSAGLPSREAATLNNIGSVHRAIGRPDSALAYFAQALPMRRALGERAGEAAVLNNIGAVHDDVGRSDSSLVYYARALPITRAIGDRALEVTTLRNLAFGHRALGHADSALAYYAQVLPIQRAMDDRAGEATTLITIGLLQQGSGQADSALASYSRALSIARAIGDRALESGSLSNIGGVHLALSHSDSALAYYAQALSIARAVGNRSLEARALNNIGGVHRAFARADSALAYYALALPIGRAVGDRAVEGAVLASLGVVHSGLGRPDSALVYYVQALFIMRAAGNRPFEALTLTNIGIAYSELGRPDSALAYYGQALPIARAAGDRASEALTLNNVGLLHANLGRPDSALAYYAGALSIRRAMSDPMGEAVTLHNIGGVHISAGRSDSALAYLAQALPIRRAIGDREGEAKTLRDIASVYLRGPPGRTRIAVAYYDSAAAVLASIAERAGGDQNRVSYAEQQVGLFADWSLASLALSAEIGPAASAKAGLAAAERGRAQALLNLMQQSASAAKGSVGSSAAITPVGADLAQEGARLAKSVGRTGSTALVYLLAGDTLLTWLIDSTGDVSVFRAKVTADELAGEVAALRTGLGADWAAVRSRVAMAGTGDLDPVQQTVAGRQAAGPRGTQAARRLSEWLIPPTLREKLPVAGELVIIPHGSLNLLPFAALPADVSGEPLGVRYSLRYAPSLATLAELADSGGRPAPLPDATTVVVGNPLMPRVRSTEGKEIPLGPLLAAEGEARWVAGRFGVTALHGAAATEAEIKRLLPNASLVHLATHGYAYSTDARVRDSFIALAPSPGEDGLLTVGELLDAVPSLRAELVVLSACQTGLGDLKQAEGTVGMQRALLAKGARSALVSLWSVSDEATAKLMRSFYTHWQNGASKADALRRAQAEVRGQPGSPYHHPRFWAAFVLVGTSR